MPSTAPRITIYTDQDTYDAFSVAAEMLDTSRSKLLGDLARSAVPVLQVMIDAAVAIKAAPLRQDEAMRALAEHLQEQVRDLDEATRHLRLVEGGGPDSTPPL